ncbi:hypothetical protein A4S06_10735 [Erysipelotrichaceae bacterium MTC7]|nr:hypothetical protein A4S06_10735 [Erysipelotrichaceae bacterium MTC7]
MIEPIYIATGISIVIFLISWSIDRRKITNGFLFNVCIGLTCISLAEIGNIYEQPIFTFLGMVGLLFIIGYLLFGIVVIMLAAFINGFILIKKEGRGLMNLFVLFVGVAILIFLILATVNIKNATFTLFQSFLIGYGWFVVIYLLINLANYIMSSLLYSVYRPRLNKDFIIVLGAGLINGEYPTPLLQRRIDKAMNLYFAHVNKQKHRKIPKIIMSGGKGPDEKVSEADAMATYAREHGVPREDLILENKSRNTRENMRFSKAKIAESHKGDCEVVFATSNYHVMRSGMLARQEGLKAQGIGSRTPFYFWFGATLREFVAIMSMYKWIHVVVLVLGLIATIALLIINHTIIS